MRNIEMKRRGEIAKLKPPAWHISRYIPENSIVELFGEYASRKSQIREPPRHRLPLFGSRMRDINDPIVRRMLDRFRPLSLNVTAHKGEGTARAGTRVWHLVCWLSDISTRDGLTPSATMIREAIQDLYPETGIGLINRMLQEWPQ
jgi:hypothetical protein